MNASLDPLDGGQSERTFQMSRALAKIGHGVEVVVTDKGLSLDRMRAIAPAHVTALRTLNERFFIPIATPARLRTIISTADIVHLMGHWSVLNAMVCREAIRLGKPYVVCPAGSWRLFGRSIAAKRVFDLVVGSRMIAKATRVIAITDDEKKLLVSRGVAEEKVVVIPNAIDAVDYAGHDDESFRHESQLGARPFILFLGRLSTIKGPDLLLEAYLAASELVRAFDLVYAGRDEDWADRLKRAAATAGVTDKIHFVGHIGGAEKAQAIHAADFLVIPSRHEAMSIVVLEAGAAGTPVLITDQCGFNDVERVGGGLVVAPTSDAIRIGLESMTRADRRAMGRKLRDFVLQNYAWGSIAQAYVEMYWNVLRGQPGFHDGCGLDAQLN